jgi:hypothetical protein
MAQNDSSARFWNTSRREETVANNQKCVSVVRKKKLETFHPPTPIKQKQYCAGRGR